jgi:hypothetical protein
MIKRVACFRGACFEIRIENHEEFVLGLFTQERLQPILFLSGKLNKAERNYHALEREALAVVTAVTKLRYYLFGITLLMDASALRQVFGEAAPAGAHGGLHSPRMVRWALSLANYDFEIIHVPGKKMVVADYLSRENGDVAAAGQVGGGYANPWRCRSWSPSTVPGNLKSAPRGRVATGMACFRDGETEGEQEAAGVFLNQQSLNKTLLQEMQTADAVIAVIRQFVEDKDLEKAKKRLLEVANGLRPADRQLKVLKSNWRGIVFQEFVLQDGILYRRTGEGELARLQLVVPPALRRLLLEVKHDGQHSGHPGIKRTLERLLVRYWWPGIEKEVHDYVTSCECCRMVKPMRSRRAGLTGELPFVFRPFERLSFDILIMHQQAEYPYALVMVG